MSTPSGGSRDPIDLSAYVSHRARAATEREAAESDERDDHAIDTTFEQDVPAEHAEDADTAASPRPARAASSAPQEQPAAERRDGIMSDGDLERLEASLRWLQRQETATRLPRAGQLPPSPRLAPFDASRRRYGGERYATAIRAPLSLEPERLAPPPASARNLSEPLGILVVSILAAAIGYVGYHVAAGGWSRSPPPAPRPQQAAFDRTPVAPPPSSRSRQDPRPAMARGDDGGTLSEVSLQRTEPLQSATATAGETILLQPGETGVQAPPPRQAIRTLDPGGSSSSRNKASNSPRPAIW